MFALRIRLFADGMPLLSKALIYKELRISCLFLSFVFYEKAVYLCKQKRETDRHGKKQKHIAHADNRKFHGAYGIYGGFPSA